MSINGEMHKAYNLYIIKNIVTIAPRGNFTEKELIPAAISAS